MQKIYIVEDDDNIREMLVYALESAGFTALGFSSGQPFGEALKNSAPALVLLDIMLPGEDGVSLLKRLKQSPQHSALPVIMLTAKGSELDRIRGLDLGADDYITKPFSVLEVISRIRAVLRRSEGGPPKPTLLSCGELRLDKERRVVFAAGQEISLTFKEFELLYYLLLNQGLVLSRDKLLEQIWGFDYSGESRTVDMHIKTLRHKLGDSGALIKTVRNVGYKLGG